MEPPQPKGCLVELRLLEGDQDVGEVIEAIRERYDVQLVNQDGPVYRVNIDDARFPHEAVITLASRLDEIDMAWGERFAWPKAIY
ncbi:MAG TPA: hypothetical protein VKB23_03020 [Solirubrobacterales bacterium]|nr:hypothetical protein [Solirubrobacterales bacterium]